MRSRSPAPRRAATAPGPRPRSRRWAVIAPTALSVAVVVVAGLVFGPREPLEETRPAVTAAAAPAPSRSDPTPETSTVVLDDTDFRAPQGWTSSRSNLPDTGDTVAHLTHHSGARVQAATLVESREPAEACETLAQAFSERFSDVTWSLALPVAVDSRLGQAATCGFRGRAADGGDVEVVYTLVRRASDSHSLLWRTIVPESVSATPAAEASAMACEASRGFDVPLPLC